MNLIEKTRTYDVEAMMSQLLQRKTTKARFSLPLTEEQATDLLTAAYMAEVAFRRGKFVSDADTRANIEELAKFLTAQENRKFGFMLCGICGNGKTTLLYAVRSMIAYLTDTYPDAFERGTALTIVDAKEVSIYARNLKEFHSLRSMPLLAIEDMGREPTEILEYGNAINPVIDLIEYRYNFQLFTAMTTNLTPKQIREKYGERVADRFNEMLQVIIFKNESYRKNTLRTHGNAPDFAFLPSGV